jgi:hypothetical protein
MGYYCIPHSIRNTEIRMKSKPILIGALFLVCTVGGALAYANRDALESALATANEHGHKSGDASASAARDPFGCHRHGALTYHCH